MWIEVEQYRAVGAALAAARRHASLTQQELAARLGILLLFDQDSAAAGIARQGANIDPSTLSSGDD